MTTLVEHLRSRHVDLKLHNPVLDEDAGVATFYLYNISGQLVGYQQYRPTSAKKSLNNPKEGRYYTYRSQPTVTLFGVESLHLTPRIVFVTEGLFDAARLTAKGVSALAVLSNNPTPDVYNYLHSLGRYVVCVCDNDTAGKKLAKFGHTAVTTEEHDLSDSSESYVDSLLEKFKQYM